MRIVSDWKFFVQALILDNCSYRTVDNVIADFDCNGLSSKNRDLCDQEREIVFKELFPERVMLDYFRFKRGGGYQDKPYDKFFVKLRNYRSGKFLYSLDVLVIPAVPVLLIGMTLQTNRRTSIPRSLTIIMIYITQKPIPTPPIPL